MKLDCYAFGVAPETEQADVAMPALLRAAWWTYRAAVRGALAGSGFDDVPRNGGYVLSAIARGGVPLAEVIAALGVSKQTAGALVDSLVVRGYLDRAVDPADRRRLVVSLTDRGVAAAACVRSAVAAVDASLEAAVGREQVGCTRAALMALVSLEDRRA
jgi:DNA-binding MarR family transcriptional regulator